MKRILTILFILVFMQAFFAATPSEKDVSNAFVAITDLSYVSAANFISFNRRNFDSFAIRTSPETSLPDALLINDADLNEFLPYFSVDLENTNFFSSLIPTIDPFVKERLTINNWKKGEAIVTGAAAFVFPKGLTFQQLISNASAGIFPKVGISFNFYVEGSLFSEDLNIKGTLIVSADSYGVPEVVPLRLIINNENYDLSFFEKAPLLLTMKNDI